MAKKRTNVIRAFCIPNLSYKPDAHSYIAIVEDARFPQKYRILLSTVDVIFADVAQPDQARIVAHNAHQFLKVDGHAVISIKANCIDSTAPAEAVFSREIDALRAEMFKPLEQITLEPYERDHAMVTGLSFNFEYLHSLLINYSQHGTFAINSVMQISRCSSAVPCIVYIYVLLPYSTVSRKSCGMFFSVSPMHCLKSQVHCLRLLGSRCSFCVLNVEHWSEEEFSLSMLASVIE